MQFKTFFPLFVICEIFKIVKCEYNFTYAMAHHCKTYTSRQGYTYDTFYVVNQDRKLAADLTFEMHLAILAASDGHVMLSSVPYPKSNEAVYEIVVGAGDNSYTDLRRRRKSMSTGTKMTPNILSATEFRAFWIKVTVDGVIEFGNEGEELPLISYADVSPIPIRYFSFATWGGVEAKYLFDCPVAGEDLTQETGNSKAVEPTRTPTEKLKKLIMDKGSRHPPVEQGRTQIHLKASTSAVRYDPRNGQFKCRLTLIMAWKLETAVWEPKHYNDTKIVRFSPGEIWRPDLMLYNSVGIGLLQSSDSEPTVVLPEGVVVSYTKSTVTTLCHSNEGHLNWPHDEYICKLEIGPWAMEQRIELMYTNASFDENTTLLEDYTMEWETMSELSKTTYQNRSPYRPDNASVSVEDAIDIPDTMLVVEVRIRRKYASLKFVIYSPLYTILLMNLLAFILPPLSEYRRGVYCGIFVILCGILGHLGSTVPTQTIPTILKLYVLSLFSIAFCVLLQSLLSLEYVKRFSTSGSVEKILRCRLLRLLLGMKSLTTCRNYNYIPGEGLSEVDQEDEDEETKCNAEEELVLVIDRALFVCCAILYFCIMIVDS